MPTSSSSLTSPLSAGTGLNSITSSGKGFIKEKRIMIMSEDQLKDITSLEQEALRKLEEGKKLYGMKESEWREILILFHPRNIIRKRIETPGKATFGRR